MHKIYRSLTTSYHFFYYSYNKETGEVIGVARQIEYGQPSYIIPTKVISAFLSMCKSGMHIDIDDRFSGLGSLVVEKYRPNEPKHVAGIPGTSSLFILSTQV